MGAGSGAKPLAAPMAPGGMLTANRVTWNWGVEELLLPGVPLAFLAADANRLATLFTGAGELPVTVHPPLLAELLDRLLGSNGAAPGVRVLRLIGALGNPRVTDVPGGWGVEVPESSVLLISAIMCEGGVFEYML